MKNANVFLAGAVAVAAMSASAVGAAKADLTLEEGFKNPPATAKPHTWYHLMNGNVTKEGITCDFEAIAKAGLGGVQLFDIGVVQTGPVKFNSDEWFDMLRYAQKEAKRLGLEICLPNGSGWANSGGPWITPEYGMKKVVLSEVNVVGPKAGWKTVLERETNDNGFYADIAVLAYPTPKSGAKISGLDAKRGCIRARYTRDKKEFSPSTTVSKDSVIDLTDKMSADGTLDWDVPAGDWTILRAGYICNGQINHAASKMGKGLEVDKLSAKAMDYYLDQYVARVCKTLGVNARTDNSTGFNNVLLDSYEVGCQNWTQGLEKTFEERMGYSPMRYLPAFAGRVVGSVDETERFLEDFRRVLADLFAENYAGRLVKLCHDNGLLCSVEPYGNSNANDLQFGQDVDIPMAEFWSRVSEDGNNAGDTGNARSAAYLAHVWGRRYAATESFTADPKNGGRWLTTPYSIKNQSDRAYCEGINRIIYHRFVHQPWPGDKYLPGMTMGRWGMHLDRTQTWWHLAPEWFRYQSRCQWMLQEGRFVADALYWCGESAPNTGKAKIDLPYGYNWDICATKVVELLKVRNGKIVTPGGVEYEMLVLPVNASPKVAGYVGDSGMDDETMSLEMVRRIGELVEAGARIVAPRRPCRAPGLAGYPKADGELRAAVAEVWSKGVMECNPSDAVKRLGVEPDFATDAQDVTWIHRRNDSADWYFVARDNKTPVSFEVSFRISGREPEIWDAETGGMAPASVWREEGGRTYVTLDFRPAGSAFVVFRKPSGKKHVVKASVEDKSSGSDPACAKKHTLVIKKALYGLLKPGQVMADSQSIDITRKLASDVHDGSICVDINNAYAGGDPARNQSKSSLIVYEYDGEERTVELPERGRFKISADAGLVKPLMWEWRGGRILAWKPLSAVLSYSDGSKAALSAAPRAPVAVEGEWTVSFPPGWGAPESVVFPQLESWTKNANDGVKYFSGTATYRKRVALGNGEWGTVNGMRVMLDLGEVKNFAEVTVNGKKYPPLWRPPFRVDVTDAIRERGTGNGERGVLDIEIKVTNLWPNRLIGDDRLFEDDCEWTDGTKKGPKEVYIKKIPLWVRAGKPSPTGRHTFTMFKHWSKEDDLLESGLLGPVTIRFGALAEDASAKERE